MGWESTKEKKVSKKTRKHALVQEYTHSFKKKELVQEKKNLFKKKRTRSRKQALILETVHEKRTHSRKNANGQDSNQETTLSVKKIKQIKVVSIGWIDKL